MANSATPAGSRPGRKPKDAPPHLKLADEHDAAAAAAAVGLEESAKLSAPPAKPPLFGFSRQTPAKPADLSNDAAWFWNYVTEQAASFQLLKPLDGPALHVAAETFARWREAVRMRKSNGLGSSNSQGKVTGYWVGVEERASLQLLKWYQEFGLTPAAEKHVENVGVGGHGGPAELPTGGDSGDGDGDQNPY